MQDLSSAQTLRIPYEIQIRPRRKSFGIEIYPGGRVLVLVPAHFSQAQIQQQLHQRRAWIERTWQKLKKYPEPIKTEYIDDSLHWYLGQTFRLKLHCSKKFTARIELQGDEIHLFNEKKISAKQIKIRLNAWYQSQAEIIFAESLQRLFKEFYAFLLQHNMLPSKIKAAPALKVKMMKGRWGCLSSKGDMTLNTLLVRASIAQIDYVVAHELCHLIHFNHSPSFYALQKLLCPEWKFHKKKLAELPA